MSDAGYNPTPQLRWARYTWETSLGEEREDRTLQQLWVSDYEGYPNQWRNVEVVEL